MSIKQKVCSYHLEKSSILKVNPCGVCDERIGCNSIQCTKCQRWVNCRCRDAPRPVGLLSCWNVFVCRTCLGHNCSVEEKLEFKRGEDVLEEVEKFCYLVNIIVCFNRAIISVVLDQFPCTVVKRWNLLLWMRRG